MCKWNGHEINMLLGRNLKRLRGKKNLSQLALANSAGLTHNFINEIENGRKWVSPDTIAKLTGVLGISPYELFISGIKGSVDTDLLNGYFDDMTQGFEQMVQDFRVQYLGKPENREPENR
ncbi:MAG: helix-turn-helix domain-containing protein [Treponema sp.]|jgi:transcriptional regulator with XRE-family HTH domain|nr:helix-turn-helix domain-containing protein [Treponema sp.]